MGLIILTVVLLTVFNMLRPLAMPQALRDTPAGSGPATSPDPTTTTTTTAKLAVAPPTTDSLRAMSTTSDTGMTSATAVASNPVTRDIIISADLIPLDAIADPTKKTKAAEINALYHRWVELLAIYETDRNAYEALPTERRQPFTRLNYYGYSQIAERLNEAGFGQAEQQNWNDRYLRCLAEQRDWEEASDHAMQYQEFNNIPDTLYYARRCHGLVGPIRVAIFPIIQIINSYIDRQQRSKKGNP